jgi:3-oxoacyl-[acyl-carrier-protein] synthase III
VTAAGFGDEVYLSAFAGEFGVPVPVDDPQLARDLPDPSPLLEDGFRHVSVSDRPAWHLGVAAARRTLDRARSPAVDALVYVTETSLPAPPTVAMTNCLNHLGLGSALPFTIGGQRCGNLGIAVLLVRSLIGTGEASSVLFVTADCAHELRYDPPRVVAPLGDGAASCLFTRDRPPSGFRVRGVSVVGRADLDYDKAVLNMASGFARGLAGAVRRALAESGVERSMISGLVTANYGRNMQTFLAAISGFQVEQVITGDVANVGHSFAADLIDTLADLDAGDSLESGAPVLLVANGDTAWGAVVLERIDDRH